ncbi:type VI secretion system accessory protein TagJ [Pokkaliibacter sp. CJK22405]|uniref:type VI secretion system accessory protein TagJ n=1 Tax=Pokkaliibacter sp. CJK22405 TaxID=3384615 RepID=UPI00398519BD
MSDIKTLLAQGEIAAAIEQLKNALRDDPRNLSARGSYIELLCIDGQLEKADQQLDMMVRQDPETAAGASNLRRLIHAAQARLDFYNGGDTSSLLGEADAEVETLLKLRVALVKEEAEVAELAAALEEQRNTCPLLINGEAAEDVRDLDDSLCGFLELLGTDGKFYFIKWADVIHLDIKPATSLVEHIWRPAVIQTTAGADGDVFIPMTYAGSNTPHQKLGRETDWHQAGEAEVFTGIGFKQILVNDEALNLADVTTLAPQVLVESAAVAE